MASTKMPLELFAKQSLWTAFRWPSSTTISGRTQRRYLDSIQTVNPTLLPVATFGTYSFSTGTGVIVANLSSVAGGATNYGGLQDLVNLSGGGDGVTGWVCQWGDTTQACNTWAPELDSQFSYSNPASKEGTTTTVGEMLAMLQSLNPTYTIPVLYADYNQTGGGDSLFMSAKVEIKDLNGIVVASWNLDAIGGLWLGSVRADLQLWFDLVRRRSYLRRSGTVESADRKGLRRCHNQWP